MSNLKTLLIHFTRQQCLCTLFGCVTSTFEIQIWLAIPLIVTTVSFNFQMNFDCSETNPELFDVGRLEGFRIANHSKAIRINEIFFWKNKLRWTRKFCMKNRVLSAINTYWNIKRVRYIGEKYRFQFEFYNINKTIFSSIIVFIYFSCFSIELRVTSDFERPV